MMSAPSYAFWPAPSRLVESSGLLDESVKEGDLVLEGTEEHSGNPLPVQAGTYFEEPSAHRTTGRHPDRPSVLHCGDVCADPLSIILRQFLEPISDRLR